ncbi:glutamate racemase [Crocinitomix algicola]|uniref:glutamate racemase n=1 Tax=Crocinitomix algicola TaxID=1740263 RepID=UPI0009F56523|nr:glutamate racemase [Crocinitomix algicola]
MEKPIGIFDSGIGGLTVAKAVSKILPNERFIYFGDTAHLPYGDKSKEAIQRYSKAITKFLLANNCKAIVIACNTASAVSYKYLRDKYQGTIPIINVIDPIIEEVVRFGDHKKVGLIATRTTVASGVYQEKMSRRNPLVEMAVLPTPLLAPMIEEGFSKDKISKSVIENYLSNPIFEGIDGLILGCTHYVLIKEEINEFFNGRIKLYDSTDIVALKMKQIFEKEEMLCDSKQGVNHFYVSDITEGFQDSTLRFYGDNLKLELLKL